MSDSDNKIFDPNPKNRIWEGERVTQSTYEHRLRLAQIEEVRKGIKSVVEYDMTGFDEELYNDEQFVPAILETLATSDFRAKMHEQIFDMQVMKNYLISWFSDRPWLHEALEGIDDQEQKMYAEIETFEAELRKANSDI